MGRAVQPWFGALFHGLPTLGVDGTLFNIENGSPADGKVHAKTGTWGSDNLLDSDGLVTKGLAGYVTTRSGKHLAFAFYINRMAGVHSVDPQRMRHTMPARRSAKWPRTSTTIYSSIL